MTLGEHSGNHVRRATQAAREGEGPIMNYLNSSARLSAALDKTRSLLEVRHNEKGAEPGGPNRFAPAFTIAISRESGTNGSLVAQALEEKLDWPAYDRELLQRVAEGMGLHASVVEGVDEKQKGWLRECLEAFCSHPEVNEFAYTRRLGEVLLSLAASGQCIIVGRGGAQFLPPATTLRVRLVAPLNDRIEVVRARRGVAREEAARFVAQTDAERARFVREHFLKDVADPSGYDLVLNCARYSAAACAELIVAALRRLQAAGQGVGSPQEARGVSAPA
jgi:cytidylate kinase